ncbi:MAG TPA: helix-turn-helix domain-containing protein [Terricaulis sp.]|jgi:Predicted transcriptional regulators|nr:helix-turn-helix domain-containing protein [Terricaulis sp.]
MGDTEASASRAAQVRDVLARVADHWTLSVLEAFEPNEVVRFTRLKERVAGVSQKMLTKTLRQLERDGLVTRHVHATVPPRVEYKLTPMGESLGQALCPVWAWVEENTAAVERARRVFDDTTG